MWLHRNNQSRFRVSIAIFHTRATVKITAVLSINPFVQNRKFPELNRALKNSESPRNTVQDKTSAHDSSVAVATHRSMITPRNLIQNTASQSTGSKQLQQQNTNSPRVPNKRQRALSPSFSETATDAGLPKQSFVKQKKVKPGVNPEKLRSLRSYANKDSQQGLFVLSINFYME